MPNSPALISACISSRHKMVSLCSLPMLRSRLLAAAALAWMSVRSVAIIGLQIKVSGLSIKLEGSNIKVK